MKRLIYSAGVSVSLCLFVRAAIFSSVVGYINATSVLGVVLLTFVLARIGKNVKT